MMDKKIYYIMLGILLCCNTSLFVEPGCAGTVDTDGYILVGNENYTFAKEFTFTSMQGNTEWIRFDDMNFNITAPNDISIELQHFSNGEFVDFEATTSGGTVWFNISGFNNSKDCELYINGVYSQTLTTNDTGVLSFNRSSWSTVRFNVSESDWDQLGTFCISSACGESQGNFNYPDSMCIGGDRIWVGSDIENKIVSYNKTTHAYVSSFTFNDVRGMAWNGTHIWTVDDDSAYLIDTSGNIVSTIADLPGTGTDSCIAYDGTFLWVGSDFDNAIYKCKTDGTLLQTIDLTTHPYFSGPIEGLTYDGTNLIYTERVYKGFTVVNTTTGSMMEKHNLSSSMDFRGIVYDASTEILYAAHQGPTERVYYYDYPYDSSSFEPTAITTTDWDLNTSGTSANLTVTWTKGTNSNYTLVRKDTSYPTSIYDGIFVYFGTGTSFTENGITAASAYSMWSWNSSGNWYSSPLSLNWSATWINVYNESNPSQNISCWTVEISNEDGSEVYYSECNENSLIINISEMPSGAISIIINATGYRSRTYQYTLDADETITLNAYLPPITQPSDGGGGDGSGGTTTQLYRVRVIDSYTSPVDNAFVTIKHYISTTDVYETVGNQSTDGYGETDFYLVPNERYKIFVSKSGFYDTVIDWDTDPDFYGANYPKVVQLYYEEPSDTTILTNMSVTIEPSVRDFYDNFTVYYNITDYDNLLEYCNFTIFFYNNSTLKWDAVYQENDLSSDGYQFSYTTVNGVGWYGVQCRFKRIGYDPYTFGSVLYNETVFLYKIFDAYDYGNASYIDDSVTRIVGESPVWVGDTVVAYTSICVAGIITLFMFAFSQKFAGFMIIICGLILGFFRNILVIVDNDLLSIGIVGGIMFIGLITLILGKKEDG